jgi:SAM-dependent methyltransferase
MPPVVNNRRAMALRACPICNVPTPAAGIIGELERTFDKATAADTYALAYCACGELILLSPEPTVDDLDLMYRRSAQFFGFYRDPQFIATATEWHTNTLYGVLSEIFGKDASFREMKLLEIGSGLAWMSRAAKALDPAFATVAQDVTAEVSGECPWADRYEVAEIADERFDALGPFDVASLTHVIEHLADPVATLRRAASLLKPNGVVFVTAPHRPQGWPGAAPSPIDLWRRWSYNHVPVHLQYFSEQSFARAARSAGLDVQRWRVSEDGEVFEAWLRPLSEAAPVAVGSADRAPGDAVAARSGPPPIPDFLARYLNPRFAAAEVRRQARGQFQGADPFPWVVLDGFLREEFAASLCQGFPEKGSDYDKFCVADDGNIGTDYANSDLNAFPAAFQELDRLLRSREFLDLLGDITGIAELVDDVDYFGGGIRESQARTFLPPHIDFNYHPRTLQHRRLNLLLYLNEDWREEWGGAIQVHRDPRIHKQDSLVASVAPLLNRCFIFETSERSWHGFNRLCPPPGRSRRGFTIYYYTQDRPDADAIKPHNTEYVEPPLPAWLVPGYALRPEDVELLTEAIGRRDSRIEMLYRLRRDADAKYAHVWKEYEYYLALSRKLAQNS